MRVRKIKANKSTETWYRRLISNEKGGGGLAGPSNKYVAWAENSGKKVIPVTIVKNNEITSSI